MKEIFKDILGYEGKYQVSNLGRVKSLNFNRSGKEGILKPGINKYGYLYVNLYNPKCNSRKVHRLVAQAFLENTDNKKEVNHINGIKTDNRLKNLEWVTSSENMIHSFRILKTKHPSKGKFGKYNKTSKKVNQYDLQGNFIKTWDCMSDITRELGIDTALISNCCLKKQFSTKGFIFIFN